MMEMPEPSPRQLHVPPSVHSRTSSPAPSYRSKFTEPELDGDNITSPPLSRGLGIQDGHNNSEPATPYFPPPPKEKGRLFVHAKSPRSRSPSLAPFILKPDREVETASPTPRWPRIVRLALRVITLITSPVIVGLLVHSIRVYYRTRDINFSGTDGSWPSSTNLAPAHFLIAVASISIVMSLMALLQCLRKQPLASISTWDVVSISFSLILVVLWIASSVVFEKNGQAGENSLVSWSCDRKHSPGNHLISYGVICGEQV
jgi:hypothetical protein